MVLDKYNDTFERLYRVVDDLNHVDLRTFRSSGQFKGAVQRARTAVAEARDTLIEIEKAEEAGQ